jgi:hypothetical protein
VSGPLATTCVGGGGPKRAGPLFVPIQVRGGGASPPPPPVGPTLTVNGVSDDTFNYSTTTPGTGEFIVRVFLAADDSQVGQTGTLSGTPNDPFGPADYADDFGGENLGPETDYYAHALVTSGGVPVGDPGPNAPFTTAAAP